MVHHCVSSSTKNRQTTGSRLGFGLGMAVTAGLACLSWLVPTAIVRLDNAALDLQFRLRGERSPGQEVVLVLVDEKSLKDIGRWPWARDKQALLIDQIDKQQPAVIGIDIIYAEPEDSAAVHALENWSLAERHEGRLGAQAF